MPTFRLFLSVRSILIGVVVIFITNLVLSIAAIAIILHLLVDVPFDLISASNSPLDVFPWPAIILLVLLSFASYFVGGYVAARLADGHAVAHALTAAAIPATIMAVSQLLEHDGDIMLLIFVTSVSIAGAAVGGRIVQRSASVGRPD